MGQKSTITLTSDEPIVIKRHEIIPDEIKESDKVIFLLRDYHECIWNSMNCKWEKFEPEFIKYLNLLKFFEEFKGKKIVIKYEDLIKNPKTWISTILIFLGLDPFELIFGDNFKKFMDEYEIHKENCFSIYKNSVNTKNGEKPSFTEEELRFMRLIHEKHCWEKG